MSRDFLRLVELVQHPRLTVAATAVLATTSSGVAGPAALVEKVTGHSEPATVMEYLEAGRTIRLGPRDTLVLTYFHSCVRETITGGVVTVGVDQSEVQAGQVIRTKRDCSEGAFVPIGDSDT